MIRAVTIDFWGTLLLDSPAADERYRLRRLTRIEQELRAAGVKVVPGDLRHAYDESGRYLARIWKTQRDVPVSAHVAAVLEALDPALPRALSSDVMAAVIEAYSSPALIAPPAFDPGAQAALRILANRNLVLCVVSNTMRTPGAVLRVILDRQGLLAHFATLTFSDECGIRKPDPEIFHLTLRRVGVPPDAAVHVGDDPLLDVEGARAAGLRVIQVAAGGGTGGMKPDAVISRLSQLPASLETIARAGRARPSGRGSERFKS